MRTCLQELIKRLEENHGNCAEAHVRAKTTNKVALEAEKEKDAAEKAVEELKRQLQPREHALMMMLVMLMICSQNLIIVT